MGYEQTFQVRSWTWSLFTSATKWLPWLHLHIHLIVEIGAESSVKLTQRPVVGGVEEEEDALPVILVGSCKKSGCLSYMLCVLYTHIYRCNDQIPTQIV